MNPSGTGGARIQERNDVSRGGRGTDIFTSDDALTNANVGVNYTILDLNTMTSSAPVRLKDDLGNDYRSTEQVEATFHANGRDVWLVVRHAGLMTVSTSSSRQLR